jgi:hypothetical protein
MRSEVAHSPKPGSRLENRSHPIFEAMRSERTCLHAVRTLILNALLKSIELEVQF